MTKSNPFGLHTITPYLVVKRVPDLVAFLTDLFGATQRGEPHVRDDGTIKHTEVLIGDSVVMIGQPEGEFTPSPATLYTYVDDCDATYAKAIELGASSVQKPTDYPHGDRFGGIRDFAGNTWWVVTHVGS